MTTIDIQNHINNEEFNKLNDDFWSNMKNRQIFESDDYSNITITSAFFKWYFSNNAEWIQNAYWFDDVAYNFMMTKYKPTLEDLDTAIEYMFKDIHPSVSYRSSVQEFFYNSRNKPTMYFQLLWEKAKTNEEIRIRNYMITKKELIEVENSDPKAFDEIKTFFSDRWIYGTSGRKYDYESDAIIYLMGKDKFKDNLITRQVPADREYHDKLRQIFTFDEMIEMLKKAIDNDAQNVRADALQFFNEEDYTEEQLDELYGIMMSGTNIRPYQTTLLSQYESDRLKTLDNLAPEKLLLAKDGVENVLGEYLRQARARNIWTQKTMYEKLQNSVFLREDEILKHVKYIDSEAFKTNPFGYITRSTFKLMNRHSSKRQRWDDNINNFRDILYRHQLSNINMNDFEYLVKETGVSNQQILGSLSTLYLNERNYPNLNIKPIIKLYKLLFN